MFFWASPVIRKSVIQHLKCTDTSLCFFTDFIMGNNISDFLSASLEEKAVRKGLLLKERICS